MTFLPHPCAGIETVMPAERMQWLIAQYRSMVPAVSPNLAYVRGTPHPLRAAPRARRHRAGDSAEMPNACPKCGGIVYMEQLCNITSPHWRSQLACKNDGCNWHGLSVLPIDALLAMGATNLKRHVQEG